MLRVPENTEEQEASRGTLDALLREGARRMLVKALAAEVEDSLERHRDERDAEGRAQVVRNGKARARKVTTGCGTLEIEAPRVHDRRPGEQFRSTILPPYMRRAPKLTEVLPVLYLRGLSTGDFKPALSALLGSDATAGLSPTTITRLTAAWEHEHAAFRKQDLSDRDYVYLFADGVHFRVRLEEDRLCTRVLIGVRADGSKERVAVEDGYRESEESWASVLRDLKGRGMRAPVLAIGDGALGFWNAVRDIWPETREQRCWVHRLRNVLDKLPKRLQAKAKRALDEIMNAETRKDAEAAMGDFEAELGAKYPKALASLRRDQEHLLTFFDFPAEHWQHIRCTNAIESPFATVRLPQRVMKGAGSRTKALLMAYKLLDMAQLRWRRVHSPELVAKVRSGVKRIDGIAEGTERKVAA
jgi:transposase-like protein